MDGSRAFENSSSRTVTSKVRMLRMRIAQTNYFGRAEVCANVVNVGRRPEKRRVVSFENIKNRSRRVSTVVSRSTIFSHRDRISARNKPDFNVGRNSDRNGRYPASLPLRHRAEETLLGVFSGTRDSHVPAEARSARRNSYY